jgi:hypothetical protein
MEPISPELALVDPELARRARALLPAPPGFEVLRADVVAAPSPPPRRLTVRRDILTRVAAWLAVPSIALNIAFLRTDSAAQPPPVSAAPRVVTVTVAPLPPKADKRVRGRKAQPREGNVAAARHERRLRARPAAARAQRVLRWPAAQRALTYDVVVWRGHRRIADVWTSKPSVMVDDLACRGPRKLRAGRYLWFVYPLVDRHPRRYGKLAKWGTFIVSARIRCPKGEKAGS